MSRGPARGQRTWWLLAALLLLALRGLAAPAWTSGRLLAAPSGDRALAPRLQQEHREVELAPLRPLLRGVRRVGYISWVPSVFRVQYTLAPTIVELNNHRLPYLLVELDGAQRAQFPPAAWRELGRSPGGQFMLLRRR